jgi:vacuolar-type H+-ATPase subunit E/Vma4
MSDQRLSRMEDKLDKLSEAIISMARMEERLVSVDKRMDKVDDVFKKFDDRMDDIERQAIARGQKIAFAERFFWMILTGAVGLCFVYLR